MAGKRYVNAVVNAIGVRLGETFLGTVRNDENQKTWSMYYQLTLANGLEHKTALNNKWTPASRGELEDIVYGKVSVERLPWEPTQQCSWWCINKAGLPQEMTVRANAIPKEDGTYSLDDAGNSFNYNNLFHLTMFKIGNCYPTKNEAQVNSKQWYDFYNDANTVIKVGKKEG